MKQFTSKKQKIGKYGEEIAATWLINNDYKIIEKNLTSKEGEIDILVTKNQKLHAIEVKSILCKNTDNISRETTYNPAQNVTTSKIQKIKKTLLKYLNENSMYVSYETYIDVYVVYIDKQSKKHKIEIIGNI